MTPTSLAPPPAEVELHEPAVAEVVWGPRTVLSGVRRRGLPEAYGGGPLWVSAGLHLFFLLLLVLFLRLGPESIPLAPEQTVAVQYFDLVMPTEIVPLPETALPSSPAEAGAVPAQPVVPSGPRGEEGGAPGRAPGPVGVNPPTAGAAPGGAAPAGGGGGGGISDRLRPGFRDPRLYSDPSIVRMTLPGKSPEQRYREHFQARIDAVNDSMYGVTGPNTDWTVKDGSGKRWGVSEEGVHLGPLTIPRFLIPTPPASGTNQDLEQEREQRRQREEIQRQEADREVRRARQESQDAARARREQERADPPDDDNR